MTSTNPKSSLFIYQKDLVCFILHREHCNILLFVIHSNILTGWVLYLTIIRMGSSRVFWSYSAYYLSAVFFEPMVQIWLNQEQKGLTQSSWFSVTGELSDPEKNVLTDHKEAWRLSEGEKQKEITGRAFEQENTIYEYEKQDLLTMTGFYGLPMVF